MLRIMTIGVSDRYNDIVMCDNDFTSLSIIMIILSRYNSYHDSITNSKNY